MKRLGAFLLDHWLIVGIFLLLIGLLAYWVSHAPPWWWPQNALGACTGTHEQIIRCKSYNLYSGSLSDISEITLPLGALVFLVGWWHQHNCHVPGCPRLQWHVHPNHGHPVCELHWRQEGSEHGLNHSYTDEAPQS